MQVSSKKINKNLEKQIEKMLIGTLSEIKSTELMNEVLNDLRTKTEKMAVMKRLGIAIYLDKGRAYEDIKNNLKVSSATIASVAENMGQPGFGELIRRIKAEQWAEEWTERISRNIKRILPS